MNPDICIPPPLPGDANDDGVVDVQDLTSVILMWGYCPGWPVPCPPDLNIDYLVDIDDLTIVLMNWST